jgi:hypothetical protein
MSSSSSSRGRSRSANQSSPERATRRQRRSDVSEEDLDEPSNQPSLFQNLTDMSTISNLIQNYVTLFRTALQSRSRGVSNTNIAILETDFRIFLNVFIHSQLRQGLCKEYILTYARELAYHLPENIIQEINSIAENELQNTYEEDTSYGYIERIRPINRNIITMTELFNSPTDTFQYLPRFQRELERRGIPSLQARTMLHATRVFLLSLIENNSMAEVNKDIVEQYITLLTPYLDPYIIHLLQEKAASLQVNTNNPTYITNAILDLENLNMMANSSSSLGSDEQTPQGTPNRQQGPPPVNRTRQSNSFQRDIERSLETYREAIRLYVPPDLLNQLLQDARTFYTNITSGYVYNREHGLAFNRAFQQYATQRLFTHTRSFLTDMQENPIATGDLMNMVSRIQSVQNSIQEIENQIVMEDIRRREKTPFGSIENIPKTPVSSNDTDIEKMTTDDCMNYIKDFSPKFKSLETKLRKICTMYTKPCANFTEVKKKLIEGVRPHRRYSFTIGTVDPSQTLRSCYRFWRSLSKKEKILFTLSEISLDTFNITYNVGRAIGPGVIRDFFQNVIYELTKIGVLVTSGSESIKRYFINPDFSPSEYFLKLRLLDDPVDSEEEIIALRETMEDHYKHFYKCIGNILCFILVNDIGLNFHLSHSILSHMIYDHDEMTDEDYLGFFMLDFPEYFNSFVKLLQKPEDIEYVGISFNDIYDLKKTDEDVTQDNFKEYMILYAKHKFIHQLNDKNDRDTYNNFKDLSEGFAPLRKLLRKQKSTIPIIDKLLTFETLNDDTINILIHNFTETMQNRLTTGLESSKQNYKIVFDNIVSILTDRGVTFPYDIVPYEKENLEPPTDDASRLAIFYNFIEKLLQFWSGYRHYSDTFHYAVSIKETQDPEKFPESHTCYSQIDIPITYFNDREKLFTKLVIASYNVESFLGNYGGKSKLLQTDFKLLTSNSKTSKTIYKTHDNFFIKEDSVKKPLAEYIKRTGGSPNIKYVAVFCADTQAPRDKSITLMTAIFPTQTIIYTPMGSVGTQTCKVDILSKESVTKFLKDVECAKLPKHVKFDAVIFENCPVLGIFEDDFFNAKTIATWKTIVGKKTPFYLGFYNNATLQEVDFSKHKINKYMKMTNHYKVMDNKKELNVLEFKLL